MNSVTIAQKVTENKKIGVKRSMDYEEIDLQDLLNTLGGNVKEDIATFDDIVNLDGAVNREIYLGSIVDGTGTTIDGYIRFWNAQDEKAGIPVEERKPIKIYIDSNGGCLVDTFTMIDSISLSKTPVWTICSGAAYSGGFFTFIAGHKRIAYPTASFMFHEGSTGNMADAGKFRNYADFYYKQLDKLKDITIKYSSISDEEYEKHKKDDWWFTADEGVEHGFVDEIATSLL